YLIGSIPFAVIVSRAMGLSDPRNYGSGNPGATNVLRSGSKPAAFLTLIGDAGKGVLVVWVARLLAPQWDLTPTLLAGIAIAVFLGHVFSIFLKFRGGKGVSTAAGIFFGIQPMVGLTVFGTWLIAVFITRYSSAAAITAAIAAPLLTEFINGEPMWVGAALVISAIVIWRHAENIRRLIAGTEGKLGRKKA
ncbi:MAG TPA: glycerol-3-phosphate 1-O-acyltransferase PlsY, partial [Rhodocyclaceae bacterium]|nr:glycerol-3-phosphate 1-O-acyltransferase PlsY [Rhodocyclaceae bacterium]